jgi:hypothetical protein
LSVRTFAIIERSWNIERAKQLAPQLEITGDPIPPRSREPRRKTSRSGAGAYFLIEFILFDL